MIRPIHTEEDHRTALSEIEQLWDAKPGTDRHDRLEVLSVLVDAYERDHYPITPPNPIDAILFRLEQLGRQPKWLERLLGPRSRVWEVLNRRRRLSLTMIRRIHRALDIPADVLLREYKTKTDRKQHYASP